MKARHKPARSVKAKQRAEQFGRHGEWLAALWLQCKGYRIIRRRLQTPLGELDLIARKGRKLVFVEVKTRRSGASLYDIGPSQADRSVRAANWFLANEHFEPDEIRFDVILLGGWQWPRHEKAVFMSDSDGRSASL